MNDDINNTPKKRKTLSIITKPERSERKKKRMISQPLKKDGPTSFVARSDAVYMVWNPQGHMPKKVYDDPHWACCDAAKMAAAFGGKYHVMRTWRFMEAEQSNED